MLGLNLGVDDYLHRLSAEIDRVDRDAIARWSDILYDAWRHDRFVYVIGNGGSGTTATHFAEDLGKSTLPVERINDPTMRRLKVLSLTDNTGWIMAVGNDLDYDQVFVQQLMNYGKPDDVLIAISGSGNSPNILRAVEWAKQAGLSSFALTGYDGGQLRRIQDDGIHVDLEDMGMVESIHLGLFHWVLNDVHARVNSVGRHAVVD